MSKATLHLGALLHVRDDPEKRPDAIEWISDGALLVADDVGDVVWRVSPLR